MKSKRYKKQLELMRVKTVQRAKEREKALRIQKIQKKDSVFIAELNKESTGHECPVCGKDINKDKKYCSKKCFYNRKKIGNI